MGNRELSPASSPATSSADDVSTKAPAVPVDVKDWTNSQIAKEDPVVMPNAAWNTHNLGWRLGSDCVAAASAGVLVAPVITMIDKGIIENASGRNTLGASLKSSVQQLLLRPHTFVFSRPFALIFALYTGTYMTANALDTATSTIKSKPAHTVTAGASKFFATSTANLSLCLYKDNQFTKLFGAASKAPRPVPTATFALFTIRDSLTIFASFNLPPVIAPRISEALGTSFERHVSSASAAQFLAPAAVQIVSTPLHLLGLDLYNRESAVWQDRARKITREWAKSCLARMGRIIPAFGVGGVVNMRTRRSLMSYLE